MSVLRARLLQQKIAANACRAFCTKKEDTPVYWHTKFPDKKARSFDEMPTVDEPKLDPYKLPEIYPQWFKKYGYIMKQPVGNGKYTVHTFHFDDFETVYLGDFAYYTATQKLPQRLSHQVIKHYRENNKHLYDNVGLAPSADDYVPRIRARIRDSLNTDIDAKFEEVTDDVIEILRAEVRDGREIELLPWLHRWGFENVGLKFLDKRLGALSGSEEADRMVQAAATTNEMVAITTLDPITDYAEHYKTLESEQNYFYSVLKKYIEEAAAQPDSKCAVKKIMEENPKDAITAALDGFQGAIQTIPLTVLMALYNLARNKDVQVQAREEALKYLPNEDSKLCSTKISQPVIIQHIIWETLRFTPPIIGNGRIIKSDMVLGGYNVPKETNVILHHQVASRLEEFYDDPLKFNPNRFNSIETDRVRKVFGGGRRACIGYRFAHSTMYLILLKMLRNFEFSYDGGEIELINRLHNEPKEPLFLKLKPVLE